MARDARQPHGLELWQPNLAMICKPGNLWPNAREQMLVMLVNLVASGGTSVS